LTCTARSVRVSSMALAQQTASAALLLAKVVRALCLA
jgi:hypothetical protein